MLRFSHPILMIFSGALWLGVGLYLLPLGIHFLLSGAKQPEPHMYLYQLFASIGVRGEQAALLLIAVGLGLGHLKSKAVLSKAVDKGVRHIQSLPLKAPLYAVYTPKYLLLLAGMVLLGMSLKFFHVPFDIRGLVDVAIGSALINGSMLYFRKSFELQRVLK
jgi:hypothetical protein